MTYNEWKDELKSNLLSVSDGERQKVLDYYAEAYADRRDAGFTESEIIRSFGAPYDAARRILSDDAESVDVKEPDKKARKDESRRKKRGAGKIFVTVLLALLSFICAAWAISAVIECVAVIFMAVSLFACGEALSGVAAIGELLMHVGSAIIAVALAILCWVKFISNLKSLTGGSK